MAVKVVVAMVAHPMAATVVAVVVMIMDHPMVALAVGHRPAARRRVIWTTKSRSKNWPRFCGALFFWLRQFNYLPIAHGPIKTAAPIGMTGGARLADHNQNTICITVIAQIHQFLHVTRCFPFDPQRLARA